ncbi:MAG TPA: aldo/keto reductase [Saprospiraceae bacterium]|nr:aldo/keto reductase [Saprospiraceae bacterium]
MVSKMGIGCSKLGASMLYDHTHKVEELLQTAIAGGVNFFDMANVYAFGQTESLIGSLLQSKRKDIIYATKGGKIPSRLASLARYALPIAPIIRPLLNESGKKIKKEAKRRQNFQPAYLENELMASLKRLRTDYIDLYQLHSPFLTDLATPGLFEWLTEQKKIGRCRAIGISVNTIEEAVWIVKNEQVDCLQIPYNALQNEAELNLFPLLKDNQIGILARVPFAQGLLTSKYAKDGENFSEKLIESRKQANQQNISMEEFALRYCGKASQVHVVLPGTSSKEHLLKNLEAFG